MRTIKTYSKRAPFYNAFTYGNFTFVDPSKSDAIDARRISCD
jgi:hypothetical protein